MAFDVPGRMRPWIAGGVLGTTGSDLSIPATVNSIAIDSFRYMFVKFSGGLLVPVTGATDKAVGVLQNKPQPGQAGAVMVDGVTKVKSNDATIVIGTPVYIDAFGMVTSTAQTKQCVGVAEEVASAASGFTIAVCLRPFGALGI